MCRLTVPLALALAWLILSPGCSTTAGALQAPRPEAISYAQLENLLGFANWDCGEKYPTAWVRVYFRGIELASVNATGELWVEPGFMETLAHELRHVKQAQTEADCVTWKKRLEDPAYRTWAEMDATCIGMKVGRQIPLPCASP